MAVTRDGIPVRVWCWPGNTTDSALIRQVKDDMRDWSLSRIVWVADRGFTSAENRRYLRKGGGSYIIGEKLRSGSAEAAAALSRQGRYKDATGNLKVKEVRIAEDERFVICFNPGAAARDAAVRARMIARLEEAIRDSDQLSAGKRAELRGVISTKPGLNRYLRVTPGELLRTDAAKAKAEENLDGKYLLRTSDPELSTEDIALGYKQLLEVERGWRDMKQDIDRRPGSTSSNPPWSPETPGPARLDTRPPTRTGHIPARQPPDSPTRPLHQLRNPRAAAGRFPDRPGPGLARGVTARSASMTCVSNRPCSGIKSPRLLRDCS